MGMGSRIVLFVTMYFVCGTCSAMNAQQLCTTTTTNDSQLRGYKAIRAKRVDAMYRKYGHCGPVYGNIVKDIFELNFNLLSWQSYKIIAASFPFYAGSRMLDEQLQTNFYCPTHHKNINQFPKWCDYAAQYGLAIPIVALGSLAFLGVDEEMRVSGWTFILGFPFLVFGNKITKKIQFDGCYRPWHECFSNVKRAGGGCPSGHVAEVTYMAALFGMRYGPKWGVPLAIYGTFVGIDFCVSNRHYLSQLVAGISWGLMYAYAANSFIDHRLAKRLQCNSCIDFQGNPGIKLSYSW